MLDSEKQSLIEATIGDVIDQTEAFLNLVDATAVYARKVNDKVLHEDDNYVLFDDPPFGEALLLTEQIALSLKLQLEQLDELIQTEELPEIEAKVLDVESLLNQHRITFEDSFSQSTIEQALSEAH